MSLTIITPPAQEPITLAEAKAHLRVDVPDDDAYIGALISAARDYTEGFQGRCLAPATLELTQDNFYEPIRLLRGPIVSVTSVKYTLNDGVTVVTVSPSDYIVKVNGTIVPSYGKVWPSVTLAPADAVKVRYTAGYTSANFPQSTKQGMLLLIGSWYENREAVVLGTKPPAKLPLGAESLLWMDRSW